MDPALRGSHRCRAAWQPIGRMRREAALAQMRVAPALARLRRNYGGRCRDVERLVVPLIFWAGLAAAVLALWLSGQAGRAWEQWPSARIVPLAGVDVALGVALPFSMRCAGGGNAGVETDVPGQATELRSARRW